MSKISPLAFIDPEAKIGENCEIGPFCFIDKNVEIGDNNVLMNSVSAYYTEHVSATAMSFFQELLSVPYLKI